MKVKFMRMSAITALIAMPLLMPAATAVADQSVTDVGPVHTDPIEVSPGTFTLSIQSPDGMVRAASLTCGPEAGTHPDAITACQQLFEADGYLERVPPAPSMCPAIYEPVTVEATGRWNSEERSFVGSFGNSCQAVAETGGVIFQY